ncbi:hypothetical protein BN13_340002 [Nostocoides jenkinsii Ben 74]|uniref:Uncharacterized protein n=1 Tax=Nostocoides jenkinsii Ben 74 TaxID=1193518 RepID=A0A077MEB8_9MICO|nr:hypothetical protein BN13_340002 [Tetrasphaera jenkinsii Ben 74]
MCTVHLRQRPDLSARLRLQRHDRSYVCPVTVGNTYTSYANGQTMGTSTGFSRWTVTYTVKNTSASTMYNVASTSRTPAQDRRTPPRHARR